MSGSARPCNASRQNSTRLPADLDLQLTRLRDDCERLSELDRALPLLVRLHQQRSELRQARAKEARLTSEEKERLQQGEKLKKQHETLVKQVESATKNRERADSKVDVEKTLHEQAKSSLRDFEKLKGSRVCRHCGQPLTRGHFEEEKQRRELEVEEARQRHQTATATQKDSQKEEKRLRESFDACTRELTQARESYQDWKRELTQASKEVARLTSEAAQTVDGVARVVSRSRRRCRAVVSLGGRVDTDTGTGRDAGASTKAAEGGDSPARTERHITGADSIRHGRSCNPWRRTCPPTSGRCAASTTP